MDAPILDDLLLMLQRPGGTVIVFAFLFAVAVLIRFLFESQPAPTVRYIGKHRPFIPDDVTDEVEDRANERLIQRQAAGEFSNVRPFRRQA